MSGLAPGTFLAGLTDEERQALNGAGTRRAFRAATALMFQGEPDDRVMILLVGKAKVTHVDQQRRELLLSIRDPGDLLGELAFIDRRPRVATVVALDDAEALVVPPPAFHRYLETRPRVAVALLENVASRFREATLERAQFGVADTMGRLAARILQLAERYGEPCQEGIEIDSPLSHEDLAAWTGASRAGVSNALRKLRELGWVCAERRNLIVRDSEALRACAGVLPF
jgi:CRP-like cAMP-binding protein